MHASAGWYGDHTVDATRDGVTVRKGLDLDTLALPALKFEIRSERDDPVGVRVVDRLPAAVDPDRVGVHADFAADQWTAFEDGRVTFTTRLDPERPVVTLYGIWMDDPSRVHELLGSPDLEVTPDPNAPSLDPVGDRVSLPTVDDSLRSVGPDALADLRADVEEVLTGARAEPAEAPTALPGSTADGDDAGSEDADGTMGDHAWTYPVERRGTGRIAAPTHADLDDLVADDTDSGDERGRGPGSVGEDHVYLRAALAETHHGGGGALLLQELANAFQVVARRVTGDAERATVDAVVKTPLGSDAVLQALVDREQVTDALVSPLVGDRDDATGIDAEPNEDTAAADREGTEELSIEPDGEDVEVVLNADGERFSELKSEFEVETDTDALEDELAGLDLPGVDTSEEPSIEELVDGGDAFDDDASDDDEFVPASVEDEAPLSFDADPADATQLDFAADGAVDASDAADAADTDDATDESASAEVVADAADDDVDDGDDDGFRLGAFADEFAAADDSEMGPFEFDAEPEATASEPSPPEPSENGEEQPTEPTDDDEENQPIEPIDDDEENQPIEPTDDGEENQPIEPTDDGETATGDSETADVTAEGDMVAVPAQELDAIRSEMRELRDRVATLESDLAAVRADLARERGVDSRPAVREGGESLETVDGVDDGD